MGTIIRWFEYGVDLGYTRMIIWRDNFGYDTYPEYTDVEGFRLQNEVAKKDGINMTSLVEVYDLTAPVEPQLDANRAMNF